MKKCQSCSSLIPDDARFCPECGNSTAGAVSVGNAPVSHSPTDFAQYSQGGFSNYGIPGAKEENKPQVVIADGERLADQYLVKRKLGQGGFGSVYEVFDEVQERPKAIKVITLENKAVLESLKVEFESRENITNMKHVIRGYDFSRLKYRGEDIVIYPMELADKSFRDWLNEVKRDNENHLEEGLELFHQTCLGVKALHDADLIHLDLKPENILLVKDKRSREDKWIVKITDFGLSRGTGNLQGTLAKGSDGVGTPWYMSPEQVFAARQKDINAKADIYALGIILFELLDGDKPFDGTPDAVKRKHKEVDPPALNNVPDPLSKLAYACLQKKPWDRPDNINEILNVVVNYLNDKRAKSDEAMLREKEALEAESRLITFIEAFLLDGVLDQEERKQVFQKAGELGIQQNRTEEIIKQQLKEKGATEKIICKTCGFTLKAHWKVCPKCKSPAPVVDIKQKDTELRCAHCGAIVKPHWKTCPKCKTPLSK